MISKAARLTLTVIVSIFLALFLYFKAFYLPIHDEIRTYIRDISSMQELSSSVIIKTGELEEVNTKLSQLRTYLADRMAKLQTEIDSHDIIVLLSGMDERMLVKNSLIFMEAKEQENFIILPVQFHFYTNYRGFMDALAYLDSLDTQVSISNLQISSIGQAESIQDPMDESGKVLYNLDVEMTLNFYIGRN